VSRATRALAALLGVGVLLGSGVAQGEPAQLIPVRIVHGQEAGPLDGGGVLELEFDKLSVGKTFEEGNLYIRNTSKRAVRLDTVRPVRLTPALRLVAVRVWLVPRGAHSGLPGGSHEWPLKDPRARFAVPAKNVTIPGHRLLQIVFALRPTRAGVHRLEGLRIEFEYGGRRYEWTLEHVIVAVTKPPTH